jgi:phospholipid/cholesterol/gamma-HCH transport system substrate-binding protein
MIKLILAAAAVLLSAFGATFFGFASEKPYEISGHFLSASGLTAGNDVVVNGVIIGKVSKVAIAPDSDTTGGALVTLQVQPKYAPLRQGTNLEIRQKSFLGNMFVEVRPGPDGNAAIPRGGSVPIEHTAAPVTLDQVMDIFDPNTRDKIKTATLEGGKMLKDRGPDVNKVLSKLPAISSQTADVTANLDRSERILEQLTIEFDRISQMMAAEDEAFRADIRNGASLLNTLAAREDRLQAEIVYADSALARINAGLAGHEKDLNQVLKEMPALQAHLRQLSGTSDPVLADANMCYSDIINAVAGLRSSTAYRYPHNAQDANGFELRVYTTINLPGGSSGSPHPAQLACAGGMPTP